MPSIKSLRRIPLWAWFGAANATAVAWYLVAAGGLAQDVLYSAVGFASGIVIVVKARSTGHRSAWYAFGATQLLWAGGDLVWTAYPTITGHEAPYPSLGDVFYLVAYPFAMIGVVVHTLRQVGDDAKKVFLDAGMVGLILAIGGWEIVVSPYLAQANVSAGRDLVGFLYPALGLALLSLSVILWHGAGARSTSNRLLALAIALVVCADLKYAGDLLSGAYHQGIWYDAGWLLGYALWAMAALHPSAAAPPVPVGSRRSALRPSRLLVPLSLVLLVVLVFQEVQGSPVSMIVVLGLGGTVFLLALMRIQGLVKELHVELQNVEEQRHASRTLMDLASDAIFISQQGNYVEANVRACELTGYSRQELLALPAGALSSSTPPAELARISEELDRGDSVVAQVLLTRKHADPLPTEISTRLLPDGRVQSIARDISGRLHAEAALRASEERFRKVFESPAVGMAVASVDGTVLQANHTLAGLLTTEADTLVGTSISDWIGDDRAVVEEAFARYAAGAEESALFEVRFVGAGGRDVWVELALAVDQSVASDPIVVVHAVDQTLARELETRLHQAQKMEAVGELAGGVAHEFNNLLSVIVNYTRFVQDVVPVGGHASRDLEEVVKAAGRGERLVRQLLAFSRRDRVRLEDLNVDTVIEAIADLLRRTLRESIHLDLELGGNDAFIHVDPVQLEQVLMNMAVNARDAMPGGGTLRISTHVSGQAPPGATSRTPADVVHVVVTDTGVGMTDEVRKRVFEPFFTTKERGSGTGLGLATVYGAVKSWGGDIEVSAAPSGGTRFDVWIPISCPVGPPHKPAPEAAEAPAAGATVLVAEDEKPLRVVAQRILERAGYRVLLAETPEAALDLVRGGAERVDLLLTDVVMPGLSGKALAEHVLALEPEMRVLYMSGYPDDIVTDHGLFLSGDEYLQKPFSAKQLVAQVEFVLSSRTGAHAETPAPAVAGGSA